MGDDSAAAPIDFTDLDRFAANGVPHDALTALRAGDPVHWHASADGSGFWLLSRHEDIIRVSRDWRIFSSERANGGIAGLTLKERQFRGGVSAETLIEMDPPMHGIYRSFISKALMPSAVARVSDRVRAVSVALIETALSASSFDFVDEIAAWVPLEALAELGNIPIPDRNQMFQWVNTIVGPDDPEFGATPETIGCAMQSLRSYCIELYRNRTTERGDDVISMMIKGEIEGEAVAAERATSFFMLLLAAGSETTRTTMTHGIIALATHPDQYQLLRADAKLVKTTALEEILRWATPVNYFRRGATADVELRGKQIKAGDTVMLCYASANRDEGVFQNPFVFDVTRHPNPHLSFGGRGPHNCLGANLARMELGIFFEELCKRVTDVTLTGPPSYLRSNLTNGIKHLRLRFLAA